MMVEIDQAKQCVDIWLKRGETPPDLAAFAGYQVVVWRSGQANLSEQTALLLRANK